MKRALVLLSLLALTTLARAQETTTDPTNCSAVDESACPSCWATHTDACVSNNARATYTGTSQAPIIATGFTYGTPPAADDEIIGIEVLVEGHAVAKRDIQVGLTKNGTTLLTAWSAAQELPGSTDTILIFGSPVDLWGAEWTDAEVNAATFGVFLRAADTNTGTRRIDNIQVRITYLAFGGATTLEGGRTFIKGYVDATRADVTRPFRLGESATCKATMGEFAITTGAPETVLQCGPDDAWTPIFAGAVQTVTVGHEQGLVVTRDEVGRVLYANTTDAGEAVQAGIDRLEVLGRGDLLWKPGAYTYVGTVPALPPNLTDWIRILADGVYVTGTADAPGLITVRKDADGDVFAYHWVQGATFNGNNVVPASGSYAALYGNLVEYPPSLPVNPETRVSFWHTRLLNLTAVNITTMGISLETLQTNSADLTPMFVKDFLAEDVRIYGGPYGIRITAGSASGSGNNVDAYYDDIAMTRCYHDANGNIGNNFFVGSASHGGRITMDQMTGLLAGDTCIEINGFRQANVSNSTCYNARLGSFLSVNFGDRTEPAEQEYVYDNCWAVHTAAPAVSGTGAGFTQYHGGQRQGFGRLVIRNSGVLIKGVTNATNGSAIDIVGAHDGTNGLRGLTLENVQLIDDINWDSTATFFKNQIRIDADSQDWDGDGTKERPQIVWDGVLAQNTITRGAGSGSFGYRGLFGQGPADYKINHFTTRAAMTGPVTTGTYYGMFLGQNVDSPMSMKMTDSVFAVSTGWTTNPAAFFETGANINDVSQFHFVNLDTTGTLGGSFALDFDFGNKPSVARMVKVENSQLRQPLSHFLGAPPTTLTSVSVTESVHFEDQDVCTTGGKIGRVCTVDAADAICGSGQTCDPSGDDYQLVRDPVTDEIQFVGTVGRTCLGGANIGLACQYQYECPNSLCTAGYYPTVRPDERQFYVKTPTATDTPFNAVADAAVGSANVTLARLRNESTTGNVCLELARRRVCSGGTNSGAVCVDDATCTGGGTCPTPDASMGLCLTPGGNLITENDTGTTMQTRFQGGGTNAGRLSELHAGSVGLDTMPADTDPTNDSDQRANAWGFKAGTSAAGHVRMQGTDDVQNRSGLYSGMYATRIDSLSNRVLRYSGSGATFGARGIEFQFGAGNVQGIRFFASSETATQDQIVVPSFRFSIGNDGYTRWWEPGADGIITTYNFFAMKAAAMGVNVSGTWPLTAPTQDNSCVVTSAAGQWAFLTPAQCAAAFGATTGSGTVGTLAMFTPSGTVVGNTIVRQIASPTHTKVIVGASNLDQDDLLTVNGIVAAEGAASYADANDGDTDGTVHDNDVNAPGFRVGNGQGEMRLEGKLDNQNSGALWHNAYLTANVAAGSHIHRYTGGGAGTPFGARGIEFNWLDNASTSAAGIRFFADRNPATDHARFSPLLRLSIGNDGVTRWWEPGSTESGGEFFSFTVPPLSGSKGWTFPPLAPVAGNFLYSTDAFGALAYRGFSDVSPGAPSDVAVGGVNVLWQSSGADISAYVKEKDLYLRTPSDSSWAGGQFAWTSGSTRILDALDDLNEGLAAAGSAVSPTGSNVSMHATLGGL